ncbi:MAG TPA: DUF4142 domain-containing protein [Blastocatellia bacterium]
MICKSRTNMAVMMVALLSAISVSSHTRAIATSAAQQQASSINDANIAAIVSVAGGLDIAYGKIAMSKAKDKQVKEFAARMVTDHSAVQKAAEELLTKLGVTPEENDTSKGLAANGVKVKEQLNKLKGKEFDIYYIDNEVSYHELVVNATENLLIPSAQNAELKSTLVSVLPLFQKHLEHARQVQASYGKNGAMGDHKMGMKH